MPVNDPGLAPAPDPAPVPGSASAPSPAPAPAPTPASAGAPASANPSLPPAPIRSDNSAQYEFSFEDNAILSRLGSKMSVVGLFMLGIGLFFFTSELVRWVQYQNLEVAIIFLALLFIVVGIWTHRAGREFLKVANTQGKDVSHLMDALANLLKCYTLLFLLFFVALIFAIIQLGAHSLHGTHESGVSIFSRDRDRSQSQGPTSILPPVLTP